MKNRVLIVKAKLLELSQKIGASLTAPSSAQIQLALFVGGISLLLAGLSVDGFAQSVGVSVIGLGGTLDDHQINYNDTQVAQAVIAILTYIEGAFGALVMVGAGIAAILASAFGQYRAALGALVVAVGAFILRSFMSTFFNTETIDDNAI
jgi:hypothetical protein